MSDRNVRYPKEMREHAKKRGLHLVTIDVPGLCFQGPSEKPFVKSLVEFLTRHLERRSKKRGKR